MKLPRRFPRPPGWTFVYYLFLLAALLAFAHLARVVYLYDGFALDHAVLDVMYRSQSNGLTRLADTLDVLGFVGTLGVAGLVLAGVLWRRSRAASVFLLLAFWGAVGMNLASKAVFARVRPDVFEPLVIATNYSFPSGHAMGSMAFALSLHVLGGRLWPRVRPLVSGLALLFAVLVGLSRMYLQVHYPSDVLAGWFLSFAWVVGLGLWYRHRVPRSSPNPEPRVAGNARKDRA